jgi:hypothetical protein
MTGRFWLRVFIFGAALVSGLADAQEQFSSPAPTGAAEINLRKSVTQREYQGRQISGEERQIGRGDTLWRILVEEKGLPERRFRSYLVVIRGLNPQVKNLDVLRAGDKIFIPLRVGEVEEARARGETAPAVVAQPGSGRTVNYRVKPNEHLYRILRDQFKSADERKLAQYYALVKDLNPERKEWETLRAGDIIRLPVEESSQVAKSESSGGKGDVGSTVARAETARAETPVRTKPAAPAKGSTAVVVEQSVPQQRATAPAKPLDVAQAMRSPARDNMQLFVKVAEATGNEVQLTGEQLVKLSDGTVRLDKSAFPVIYNAALDQRVVVDPDGKIPASVKAKLNDPSIGTPVLPMANGVSITEAVKQMLVGIGYQPLPSDRPVIVQEGGLTFEAKGAWMALGPAVSNRPQEVIVINVTEHANEIPQYLTAQLAKQGLHFRDVVLPPGQSNSAAPKRAQTHGRASGPAKELPREKREIIDALLLSFQIPFGVAENISVELRDGLKVDTLADRMFELDGKRTAIFFRRIDPAIRQALLEKQRTSTVELDLNSMSSRQVITRILSTLGDHAEYKEHRFAAADGAAPDRLTLKAWGFNVQKKPMFVTDREIPPALHRFFFEKGLDIVYFR